MVLAASVAFYFMLNSPNHYSVCVCLYVCVPQAETRAEFAERTVTKLEKSIDDLEGMRTERLTCVSVLNSAVCLK